MKIERGSFSLSGTPPFNTTILFSDSTLLADEITFSMGPNSGTLDSVAHGSTGFMTPTQQTARALIYGGSTPGGRSEQVNNKCILHYNVSGSSLVKSVQASRANMSTAGEFTLNVDTLNGGGVVYFIAKQH